MATNNDVQNILAEVFRLTGTRLTADDPIVAVLLMQQHMIDAAVDKAMVQHDDFLISLAKQKEEITDAAETLKSYRQQILTELLQKTNLQIEDLENRLYAGVQAKVSQNLDKKLSKFLSDIRLTLIIGFVFWILCSLIFHFFLR